MTCCTLGNLKIRTLKPYRFKNQSIDILKLLDQNYNHQQGFIKQETKTEKKNLYGSFLWMGFNCPKASATLRRQFTFYH